MSLTNRSQLAARRVSRAREMLRSCGLCPRLCGVDRAAGETGECETGPDLTVSAVNLHLGEEPAIGGTGGSCNVFMTGCNLHCISCQNHPISHQGVGRPASPEELVKRVEAVLKRGTDVLNVVTGTHQIPALLEPLAALLERHPALTVVWNSSGYERVQTLSLLQGLVDVYLPDLKFLDDRIAAQLADAPDYPQVAMDALREMARQVGPLQVDDRGRAVRGLIVRHLVLPGDLSTTQRVLEFIARELPAGTAVSLMGQYVPAGRALAHPLLGRRLHPDEYRRACLLLHRLGLVHGWTQDPP